MDSTDETRAIVRSYHDGWASGNLEQAVGLLDADLVVEVPVNDYTTTASFAEALRGFAPLVSHVEILSELAQGDEATLLYDMEVQGLGEMRVAEHFTVADGRIVRLRQIHDTAGLREAG